MALQYFDVYERKGCAALALVDSVLAEDAADALRCWAKEYGDNYGKVLILPQLYGKVHVGFDADHASTQV